MNEQDLLNELEKEIKKNKLYEVNSIRRDTNGELVIDEMCYYYKGKSTALNEVKKTLLSKSENNNGDTSMKYSKPSDLYDPFRKTLTCPNCGLKWDEILLPRDHVKLCPCCSYELNLEHIGGK